MQSTGGRSSFRLAQLQTILKDIAEACEEGERQSLTFDGRSIHVCGVPMPNTAIANRWGSPPSYAGKKVPTEKHSKTTKESASTGRHSRTATDDTESNKLRANSEYKTELYIPSYIARRENQLRSDTLSCVNFPEPYGDLSLDATIEVDFPGEAFEASALQKEKTDVAVGARRYAVQFVTFAIDGKKLIEAYQHLEMVARSVTTRDVGAVKFHPFISQLLSEKVVKLKDLPKNCFAQSPWLRQGDIQPTSLMLLFDFEIGGDLNQLAFKTLGRPMRLDEAIFYVAELAEVLLWLIDVGMVYASLNAENIHIQADGHIKLTNFASAYIEPENIAGCPKGVTTSMWYATDWYYLGYLFYRLVNNGEHPPAEPNLNMPHLPAESGALIRNFLQPHDNERLGTNPVLRGQELFTHPGFIKPLLGIPSQPSKHCDYAYSAEPRIRGCGSHLTRRLQSRMENTAYDDLNSPASCSIHIKLGSSSSVVYRETQPNWVDELRQAIRDRVLIPPFKPKW